MLARHKINGAGILRGLDFAKGGRWVVKKLDTLRFVNPWHLDG